jgi:HK97 gp10 family phage protein
MKVVVHRAAIAAMMSPTGEVGRAAMRAAGRVRDRAKDNAPVDNGLLRNSIVSELAEQGLYNVTWRIGSNIEYAIYQELGTQPIFARRAPLLVFKIGNQWVSTKSTRGVPAVRYLTRAIEGLTIEDFR